MIPIHLAVEDDLSEAILRVMMKQSGQDYAIGQIYKRHGHSYLQRTISGFNNAARITPYLVLTDLDDEACPPALIESWLPVPPHPNLIFRVAVREVEAWVMADRIAFAAYLGVRIANLTTEPDGLDKPKGTLIALAMKSKKRALRQSIAPKQGSTSKIGPGYNSLLRVFLEEKWQVDRAEQYSPSLAKAMNALRTFRPTWRS